ncbi:MAG: CHAD domain-containing protein, partial [Microthrixaceae bacterium]
MNAADRQQPAGRVLPLLLDEYLQQFRSFEQSVLTDQDPEDLHSLRVALRRARSLLSLGGAVFPSAQRKELIQQMRDFGSISSQVRDLDVLIGDLPKLLLASRIEVSKLGVGSPAELLQQTLVRQREAAFAELARAIDATAGGEPNNQSAAQ